MKYYKEVAKKSLYHNGKPYEKGAVVRERVPLTDSVLRELEGTPELTNCEYILIDGKKKAEATKADKPAEEGQKAWKDMNGEERKAFQEQKKAK